MFPIGNLLPALALDRIGRRWTMIWGCAGLSLCMMFLAALLIFGGTINVVPWGELKIRMHDSESTSY
jgi:MFS family permease